MSILTLHIHLYFTRPKSIFTLQVHPYPKGRVHMYPPCTPLSQKSSRYLPSISTPIPEVTGNSPLTPRRSLKHQTPTPASPAGMNQEFYSRFLAAFGNHPVYVTAHEAEKRPGSLSSILCIVSYCKYIYI